MINKIRNEKNEFRKLLNGQWIETKSENYIEIKSAINNSFLGKIPAMSKVEVDEAIKNSKEAQKQWKFTPLNRRVEILYKAAELLEKEADNLAIWLMMEVAKDKKSARTEVIRTADFIRFTADTAKNI